MSNTYSDNMDELLAKLLAGEATPEERAQAESWLAADPSHRASFEQLKKIWDQSAALEPEFDADTDAAWKNVKQRMQQKGKVVPLKRPQLFARMAAALVLLIGLATTLYYVMRSDTVAPDTMAMTLRADKGPQNDTLADGSQVALNAGGVLQVSDQFNGRKERRVRLQGEAFFEVAHNKEKPFIIEAGPKATVRVLGTSFNVDAQKDGSVDVSVKTGRVLFRVGGDSLVLTPGESGHFDPRSGLLSEKQAIDPNFDAWKTHKIVFRNTQLDKAIDILNKFYHANIRIASEQLRTKVISAEYDNISLDEVLELIKLSYPDIRIERTGAEITLVKDTTN